MKRARRFLRVAMLAGTALVAVYFAVVIARERSEHRFDTEIAAAAQKTGIDPELVRAVIWRESNFNPKMVGKDGERGLMQITEIAAADWTRVNKIKGFSAYELFDPLTNIEVGSWILRRSLERWKDRDDPMVFALAEYNAGRSRALAWVDPQRPSSAEAFRKRITINSTRKYVESISARYRFYKSEEARSVWINWVLRLPPRRLAGMWNRLFTTATENGSDK